MFLVVNHVSTLHIVTREDSLYAIQAASPPVLLTFRLLHNLNPITSLERQVAIGLNGTAVQWEFHK